MADGDCATDMGVKVAYARREGMRAPLSEEESKTTSALMKGCGIVETPGSYDSERPDSVPEPVTLPEPKTLNDYVTAPCKHESGILKQIRHAKQAHRILSTLNPTRQSLLRAIAGQCGLDSAHCHSSIVLEVVSLDRPGGGRDEGSREASLF